MKTSALTLGLWTLSLLPATAGEPDVIFQDDFKGKLADGWTWVREDPKAWRVTEDGLEVRIQPGNMWGPSNNAKNVLVRPVPDPATQPLEVSVTVSNKPTEQYEQVDLVWYYDDSHQIKIGLEQVDKVLCLVMGREEKDGTRTIAKTPIEALRLDVRFLVSGDKLKGQYRPAGEKEWKDAGECTLPVKGEPKISLQVYQGPATVERWGKFTAFKIVKGKSGP
jgi:regulation of enolase protein 1 (concanavalin A-like superfamily)